MRRLAIGGLSILLMSAVGAPAVSAEMTEQTAAEMGHSRRDATEERLTSAFDLVTAAYRGRLEEQGIPGYTQLLNDYGIGEVTAEEVVRAGVEADELRPEAVEDDAYINAVDLQLNAYELGR